MKRREAMTGIMAAAVGLLKNPALALAQPIAEKPIPSIPGPDPNTRTPTFHMPPLACDTHTHIFGPQARYPFSAKRPYTPPDAGLDDFRAVHQKLGIERAVIVNATVHGFDNSVVTDAIAQSNGRYLGIANVSPDVSDQELAALNAAGIRGCRFVFLSRLGGRPDFSSIERIAPRIGALGWHLDLYIEAPALPEFVATLMKLPVPYVLDHMAVPDARKGLDQPGFVSLVELLRRDEKAWVKLTGAERISATGAPYHDAVPFAQALIAAAPERVLWGTDWPHPNVKVMPNDGDLVDLVPLYAPDSTVRQKLLVDNPQRLYRFMA